MIKFDKIQLMQLVSLVAKITTSTLCVGDYVVNKVPRDNDAITKAIAEAEKRFPGDEWLWNRPIPSTHLGANKRRKFPRLPRAPKYKIAKGFRPGHGRYS